MPARQLCVMLCLALVVGVAGCTGRGDEQPENVIETPAPEPVDTRALETTPSADKREESSTGAPVATVPLARRQRREIDARAADTAAAFGRWDAELAACVGPSGDGDHPGATCTHAAWEQLVFQVEIAIYYLLGDVRTMPEGPCHDALKAENDVLRGFWHGAAPLNLAWLDEHQQPPSRFDLESAVDLVRPVPERIGAAVTSVCAG